MNWVEGYGNTSARLVFVGEAPGGQEEQEGIPFVGPTGQLLEKILNENGLGWEDVYKTNVVKVRPPGNDISKLAFTGYKLEDFIPLLWKELDDIRPNCIVACGNIALEVLTGCKGIRRWRGSILSTTHGGYKCIPIIHPASLMHGDGNTTSWKELAWIKFDIARAIAQSEFGEISLPKRQLTVAKSSYELYKYLKTHNDKDDAVIDVETSKTVVNCVSIAFSPKMSMSVPTGMLESAIPENDLPHVWKELALFFQNTKKRFAAQNGKFDERRQREIGLPIHDLYFDTALAWHVLFPEFPKRLEFIASVLTEEPFYKDEGREFDARKHDINRLYMYNAKDSAVEFECMLKEIEELKEIGMYEWFIKKQMPLHRLYYDMEDVGILIDEKKREFLKDKYIEHLRAKKARYTELAGYEVNANSPKQVDLLLYTHLGLPRRKDVAEDTLKALMNNTAKKDSDKELIKLTLEIRKIGRIVGTYLEAKTYRGRIYTVYNVCGTETGRTSTSKREPPNVVIADGIALQTMTKHEDVTLDVGGADLRSMFIADPGCVLIEVDGAQAEDRVVVVLAKDEDGWNELHRKDYVRNKHGLKDDRHSKTAMMVCEMLFEDLTDFFRQIGKRTRHAGNYDIMKHQLMMTLAKYGIYISEYKAGIYIERFHQTNPNIRGVFHEEIKEALMADDMVLKTPHGRRRQFFDKWGRELWKEAFAFIPQATVSDQTKFAALKVKNHFTPKRLLNYAKSEVRLCLEAHDSFTAIVPHVLEKEYKEVATLHMEEPIDFSKCSLPRDVRLVIPADIKIGERWNELH